MALRSAAIDRLTIGLVTQPGLRIIRTLGSGWGGNAVLIRVQPAPQKPFGTVLSKRYDSSSFGLVGRRISRTQTRTLAIPNADPFPLILPQTFSPLFPLVALRYSLRRSQPNIAARQEARLNLRIPMRAGGGSGH